MSTILINGERVDGIEKIKIWIVKGIDKVAVDYAEKFGEDLAILKEGRRDESLSTSQIRNIFGSVKKMEMKGFNEADFLLLKPKLAYAAKRAKTKGAEKFEKVFSSGIDTVVSGETLEEKAKRFSMFCKFFEAVLSYHRAKGGK